MAEETYERLVRVAHKALHVADRKAAAENPWGNGLNPREMAEVAVEAILPIMVEVARHAIDVERAADE